MTKPQDPNLVPFIPLLIVGMMLNTLGIVFTDLGWFRFVFMFAGLGLILTFLLKALAMRRSEDKPDVE